MVSLFFYLNYKILPLYSPINGFQFVSTKRHFVFKILYRYVVGNVGQLHILSRIKLEFRSKIFRMNNTSSTKDWLHSLLQHFIKLDQKYIEEIQVCFSIKYVIVQRCLLHTGIRFWTQNVSWCLQTETHLLENIKAIFYNLSKLYIFLV
jgi:hypothetical protein